jgi:hypothetical protein
MGIRCASGETDPPRRYLHDEEEVEGDKAALRPDLDRREVDRVVCQNPDLTNSLNASEL